MKSLHQITLAALLTPLAGLANPQAPISLQDPDGTSLRLEKLEIRVAAHGPLALTELDMHFRNPEDYAVEGKFTCLLPPEGNLSRFAREFHGKWMEGEVVERRKAKQAYSSAIASGGGGSLLEQVSGSRFQAKVFPVEARSVTRLLLSYTSQMRLDESGARLLPVPLRGLGPITDFSFRAHCRPLPGESIRLDGWLGTPRRESRGDEVIFSERIVRSAFTPGTDLLFRFSPGPWNPEGDLIRAGEFEMTVLRPSRILSAEEREPEEWVLLLDTSASLGVDPEARIELIQELVAEIDRGGARKSSISLFAFDLEVSPLFRFRAGSGRAQELAGKLRHRGFLGSTNLGAALEKIGELASKPGRRREFLLVSDAIATQGETETAPLLARLGTLPEASRVHVVTLGGSHDQDMVRAITQRGKGRRIDLPSSLDPRGEAIRAVAEIRRVPGETFRVQDPEADWVFPRQFQDVAPGQELVIFSHRRSGKGSALELVDPAGKVRRPTPRTHSVPGFRPLLERQAYRAWIRNLKDQESHSTSHQELLQLRAQQIRLSTRHRVLCPYTSLLILNFEEDYERYGIDRRQLAEVLVVGDQGVALKGRSSQGLHTFTDEQWEAAKASQKARNFPAGRDPLIKIRAPEGTRRIVALFPWGETKPMVLDPRDGYWKARFVIPRWQAHGTYPVILVLTRADGSKTRLVVHFGADRKAPEGAGSSRAWRTPDGFRVHLQIEASPDTLRAEAQLPGGTLLAMKETEKSGGFELSFDLEHAPGPSFLIPITLFDSAHNILTLEVEVELR